MSNFTSQFTGNNIDEILNRSNKYTNPTALSENTDLNSIMEAGAYSSWSSSKSVTITNRPPGVVGGFTIYVISPNGLPYGTYNQPCQIYIGTDRDAIFIRYYNVGNNAWEHWYMMPFILAKNPKKGTTSERPVFPVSGERERFCIGYYYFDTTLNKPIWWNGDGWVDATGASV